MICKYVTTQTNKAVRIWLICIYIDTSSRVQISNGYLEGSPSPGYNLRGFPAEALAGPTLPKGSVKESSDHTESGRPVHGNLRELQGAHAGGGEAAVLFRIVGPDLGACSGMHTTSLILSYFRRAPVCGLGKLRRWGHVGLQQARKGLCMTGGLLYQMNGRRHCFMVDLWVFLLKGLLNDPQRAS